MRNLLKRGRAWLMVTMTGGSLFVLAECDPAVRETVLQGVGAAATSLSATFIQAFVQSLSTEDTDEPTTVQADFKPQDEIFA